MGFDNILIKIILFMEYIIDSYLLTGCRSEEGAHPELYLLVNIRHLFLRLSRKFLAFVQFLSLMQHLGMEVIQWNSYGWTL